MAAGTAQESRLAIVIDTRDAEARIRRLREQLRELGGAADDTTDDTNRLDRANNNLNGSTSRLNKTMAIASKAFKYGAAALVGVAVAAVKVSGDFEEAMNAVKAVSGATGKDFDDLRELAKKMGSETAFSATEAANGMEYLAMAGMNTQQVLATIPNALNLAAAGSIELATSADILSNIMSGMGIAAEESARVADVLAATAAGANTDISALGEAMKYVAPIAKTMGYSLEEASSAIGILGNAGIASSQAGTSLRAILSRLAADKGAKETLADLGVTAVDASGQMRSLTDILTDLQVSTADLSSADQIEVFKDIAGAEAMGALAVLVDGVANESLPQLTAKLMEAEGAAKRMADIRMEGLNGAIKGAKSAAEGFLIALGDSGLLDLAAGAVTRLADGIRFLSEQLPIAVANITAFFEQASVADTITLVIDGLKQAWENLSSVIERTGEVIKPVIDFFIEHEELSKSLATAIGIVAAGFVIYNAAVAIGTAVTGGFAAALALATAPITLIIIGLTALVTAGVYVYRNWDMLKAKALEVFGGLPAPIQAAIAIVVNIFSAQFEIIKTIVSTAWEVIKAIFTGRWGEIGGIVAEGAGKIWTIITTKFDNIKPYISAVWQSMKEVISNKWSEIKQDAITYLSALMIVMSNKWDEIKYKTKNKFNEIKDSIITTLKELPSKLLQIGKDIVMGLVNGIKSGASGVTTAIGDMASSAVAKAKSVLDIRSPSRVMKKVGEQTAEGMAKGIKKGAKAVKTEAQKMAEGAIKAVQDGVASLKREIALFGNDSALAALDYDIKVGKFGGANTGELRSLTQQKEQLELSKKLADANKSVQDSIDGLIKQQALFGNNSSLASLMYDIEHTEKYKNITQELKDELIAQTKAFEQLGMTAKATDAIRARFAKLKTDQEASGKAVDGVMGELQAETAIGKIQADYERRIEVIRKHEELTTGLIGSEEAKRIAIYESAQKAKELIQIQGNEKLFGELSSITKTFFGEQSAAHRAMFAVEKYFALKRILVENKVALAKAWASAAFPYNLPAVATVAAQTGLLAAAVKGFKQGGYTGNMGVNQVAGAVHGQEYVFDAQSTKRIGVDNLNAMRSGRAANDETNVNVTVNNHTSAKVETQTDSNGNIIMTIRDEIKKSWTNTGNPNSFESKQLNRNLNTSRRR